MIRYTSIQAHAGLNHLVESGIDHSKTKQLARHHNKALQPDRQTAARFVDRWAQRYV